MIMIRRIECVLEENRAKFKSIIISKDNSFDDESIKALYEKDSEKGKAKDAQLTKKIKQYEKAKLEFHNTTNWTLKSILADSSTLAENNFRDFLNGFSENIEEVVDKFEYRQTVRLSKNFSKIIRL